MKPHGSSGKRAGVNYDTDPAIKCARAVEKRAGERDVEEQLTAEDWSAEEAASTPIRWVPGVGWVACNTIIPGTFIMCGEGGNYCSDECMHLGEP